MHQGQMIGGLPFPTDQERPESIVPTVGPFYNPAPRLAVDTADEGRLAPAADVRHDAPLAHRPIHVSVVVAFVQAEVAGATWSARAVEYDRIEHGRGQPFVVPVGRCDQRRERDPAPIREEVALRAPLPPVGRIRSRMSLPFGALTVTLSSAAQRH
jgi:hypothetical protein